MDQEYTLVRDIVYDHNARMLNIKKYYPYFRLQESDFSQYQGGRFERLDMGYILMAVLRFFIEENNFKERDVAYEEYEKFMHQVYVRDFDMTVDAESEKLLTSYIFDKIRNEGKPFTYNYYDPEEKQKKVIRMRIIDSRIKDESIVYYITADAIEFYLDTKEIKDESTISIAQVLLGKMIETRNFRGGTDVIRRINGEVSRLKMRKNDVLNMLSNDVFEGTKAYEEFNRTVVRWFDEEQKLFEKNMELIREAMKRTNPDEDMGRTAKDIYDLETELKKAILKHSELLDACTDLQLQADSIISGAKFTRLKRSFDFSDAMKTIMKKDNTALIETLIVPLLKLNIKKTFSLTSVDKLLSLPPEKDEKGEEIKEAREQREYIYDDEIEEERIQTNFIWIIRDLFDYMLTNSSFTLKEYKAYLEETGRERLVRNADFYTLLVHMCQKDNYDIAEILKEPDTFFEKYIKETLEDEKERLRYGNLSFRLEFGNEEMLKLQQAEITNISFEVCRV